MPSTASTLLCAAPVHVILVFCEAPRSIPAPTPADVDYVLDLGALAPFRMRPGWVPRFAVRSSFEMVRRMGNRKSSCVYMAALREAGVGTNFTVKIL